MATECSDQIQKMKSKVGTTGKKEKDNLFKAR